MKKIANLMMPALATLVGLPAAHAADYNCLPIAVQEFPTTQFAKTYMKVRCSAPTDNGTRGGFPTDGTNSIEYFGVQTTDKSFYNRVFQVIQVAMNAGFMVRFSYTAGDTKGSSWGCDSNNCRTPTSMALVRQQDAHLPLCGGMGLNCCENAACTVGLCDARNVCTTNTFEWPDMRKDNNPVELYLYTPPTTGRQPWAFDTGSGISGNQSGLTDKNSNAPDYHQVAFIQQAGSISITAKFPTSASGMYKISAYASQRGNYTQTDQTIDISVDGQSKGNWHPTGTSYTLMTTGQFTMTPGNHVIKFTGLATSDSMAFLDKVRLEPYIAPASNPCAGVCSNPTVFTDLHYQSGSLTTNAVCRETTINLASGNCSNMSSRTLTVNGKAMNCAGWTLPAKVNGGYCIQVTAGTPDYASFATW